MLFVALDKNSDLVCGSLRHLNALHRLYPTHRFYYDATLLENCRFDGAGAANTFMDDFLLTLYACTESAFNGARQETLIFFEYWTRDAHIANTIFERITSTWPWTNRNKYYFLSIICERHDVYALLQNNCPRMSAEYFMQGVCVALQYRNLISPGQTLAITLTRQQVPEAFTAIANILRGGSDFEMLNCVNHWMRCVQHKERIFAELHLDDAALFTTADKFQYLHADNGRRLVLFRSCFQVEFEKLPHHDAVDAFCMSTELRSDVVQKIPIFSVITARTMTAPPQRLAANLSCLERFLKENMADQSQALRQDILKMIPNLLYLFAGLLRNGDPNSVERIGQFFRFVRVDIFECGIGGAGEAEYQPLIFGLRIYEIILKTLYGSRADRLIKRFNPDVNNRLKMFLATDDRWPLCGPQNYQRLIALLRSDYDDVRDITCELLIRFYPPNDIDALCMAAIRQKDIHQCGNANYLARVAFGFNNRNRHFYGHLKQFVRDRISPFCTDPLRQVRDEHLFGALNCLNEYYSFTGYVAGDANGNSPAIEDIEEDIRMCAELVTILMRLLGGDAVDGSPSFERMDEALNGLVEKSEGQQTTGNVSVDKKYLLLSIWMTIKVKRISIHNMNIYNFSFLQATCDLAASIGVKLVGNSTGQRDDQEKAIQRCFDVSVTVLLQCRHKGAIESAGLSMGRLVKAITEHWTDDTRMYKILIDSVGQIFAIIDRTDTTRRGAGFSIMVHNLVKSDRHRKRVSVQISKNKRQKGQIYILSVQTFFF